MTLMEAGMQFTEASELIQRGITTVAELQQYVAEHEDWRNLFGRVLAIGVENFLAGQNT